MEAEYFGTWLLRTLSKRGIKQTELASKAGVSDGAVSRWINKGHKPDTEALDRIAAALALDPLRLYVTAGRIREEVAGAEPYPMPAPDFNREHIERYITNAIPGVTRDSILQIMETVDDVTSKESTR